MSKRATGIGPFRKGKYYRRNTIEGMVKFVHGKPRDYMGNQHLLVTVRMPTNDALTSFLPVMATAPTADITEWDEITKEDFDRTMAGSNDPTVEFGPVVVDTYVSSEDCSE